MSQLILQKRAFGEDQLPQFCQEIRASLEQSKPFALCLIGEMGAGKTTFVREYLKACGLAPETPVMSPTYTIVNEYCINKQWYAHLDLYRAESHFSFEELGLTDLKEHRGFFIEWPQQADISESLTATHELYIERSEEGVESSRLYTLISLLD